MSDTLAAVLRGEPDWSALPATTPISVRRLLRRALAKDSGRRLADVADLRLEIDDSKLIEAGADRPSAPEASRWKLVAVGTLAGALVASAVTTWWVTDSSEASPTVVRLEIVSPPGVGDFGAVRVSPDGRTVAFVALSDGANQIWSRSLDSSVVRRLEGTDGASAFFWSPDSQSIAFAKEGRLQVVPASGGTPRTIGALPSRDDYYGSWGSGGDILLSELGPAVGSGFGLIASSRRAQSGALFRIPATGGSSQLFQRPDPSLKEEVLAFPNFLPDGRRYLFIVGTTNGRFQTYVGDLESNERVALPGIESSAIYSSSGHVMFLRNGALMAQAFDAGSLQLRGEAVTLEEQVTPLIARTGRFSVANNVTAYSAASAAEQPAWSGSIETAGDSRRPCRPVST